MQKENSLGSIPENQGQFPGVQQEQPESTAVIFGFVSPPALPTWEKSSEPATELLFASRQDGRLSPVPEEDFPRLDGSGFRHCTVLENVSLFACY